MNDMITKEDWFRLVPTIAMFISLGVGGIMYTTQMNARLLVIDERVIADRLLLAERLSLVDRRFGESERRYDRQVEELKALMIRLETKIDNFNGSNHNR